MDEFERRRQERERSLNFLEFAVLDRNGEVTRRELARTLNVSDNGLLLETPTLVEQGETLRITLGLEDDLVELQGEVRHVELAEPEKFSAGVEFTAMGDNDRQVFRRYLEAFRAQSAE